MIIGINPGHTKFERGTGAVGHLTESIETRKIAAELMALLADSKHEVYYLGIDRHQNNLKYVVDRANNLKVDMFISIHLNAGKGRGVEVYTWKGRKYQLAENVVKNVSKLGYVNRGIKDGSGYYVIRNTKMEAMIIECCFVDSDDYKIYDYRKIAKAIYDAIGKG